MFVLSTSFFRRFLCFALIGILVFIQGNVLIAQEVSEVIDSTDSIEVPTEVPDVTEVEESTEPPDVLLDTEDDTATTSDTVSDDTNAADEEVIQSEAEEVFSIPEFIEDVPPSLAEPLTFVSEKTEFSFTEQISFTFSPEEPFIIEGVVEETTPSFTGTIVDAVTEVTNQVVEGISNFVDAIGDFFGSDTDEVEESTEVETTDAAPVAVPALDTQEESQEISENVDVPNIEIEPVSETQDATSTEVEEIVTEPILQDDDVVVKPEPTEVITIDGNPVVAQVEVLNDRELRVSFIEPSLLPGAHHVRINVLVGVKYYEWEGNIVVAGDILREEMLTDMYRVYVMQTDVGASLWFLDMSVPVYEYRLLAEIGTFGTATPITYFDNTIFWISNNNEALNGYDILARTTSSQALERNNETPLKLDDQSYLFAVEETTLTFTPEAEKTLYADESTF